MTLGNIIRAQPLQDAVSRKQDVLILYAMFACLDTITTCIGKEATNPDMAWEARTDTWTRAISKQFAATNNALMTCLQQLELMVTGGALLPKMPQYVDSNQKWKHDNEKILSTAKQLKILTAGLLPGGHSRGGRTTTNPPQGTTYPQTIAYQDYHSIRTLATDATQSKKVTSSTWPRASC